MTGGRRRHKADFSWHRGIWLGHVDRTDEHIVGSDFGIETVRNIKRLVKEKQADVNLFKSITGVP